MLIATELRGERRFAGDASKQSTYTCPSCLEGVILKQGQKVVHHFAHKAKSDCRYGGESREHLQMKEWIYQNLRNQGWVKSLDLEVPLGDLRADALLETHGGERFAIECQVSAVDAERVKQKLALYGQQKITPVYLIHMKNIRPEDKGIDLYQAPRDTVVTIPKWARTVFDATRTGFSSQGYVYCWDPSGLYMLLQESVTRGYTFDNGYGQMKYDIRTLTTKVNVLSLTRLDPFLIEWQSFEGENGSFHTIIWPESPKSGLTGDRVKFAFGRGVVLCIVLDKGDIANQGKMAEIKEAFRQNPGEDKVLVMTCDILDGKSPLKSKYSTGKVEYSTRLIKALKKTLGDHRVFLS